MPEVVSIQGFDFDDFIVLHFGGEPGSIDADTFARSLLGFVETALAINEVVNPGQKIELRLEARGPGSYRAVIRRIKKDYGGIFSRGAEAVFWGVVATAIYENVIKNDPDIKVIINTSEVIVQKGTTSTVIPRAIYDSAQNANKQPEVRRGIRHTFEPLAADASVTEFGILQNMTDAKPLVNVPRASFPALIDPALATEELTVKERIKEESARLYILKAWLNHAKRKWSFEWNGVPISAPIIDTNFLDRLQGREFTLGAGDALDAVVAYRQEYDSKLKLYKNDENSYVIIEVKRVVPND